MDPIKMVYSHDDEFSVVFTAEDTTGDELGLRDVRISRDKWNELGGVKTVWVTIEKS